MTHTRMERFENGGKAIYKEIGSAERVARLTRGKNESAAGFACRHLLTRMGADPNLAHCLIHTQAMELAIEGVSEELSVPRDEVRRMLLAGIAKQKKSCDLVKLRKENRELRKKVKDLGEEVTELEHRDHRTDLDIEQSQANQRAIWQIEDRVRMAELGVEELDAEWIRDILDARFRRASRE